ncbi:MAG: YbaK/EbsC family protein [Actinomycetota bacterium]|jgi:prolyl-tRNA editing enzyme YbaK/EbsC (Cys-tRNA(Pro) deacylase)|nr:YbaK/EbsC family protein [Actinomycetota bacterium]
MPPWPEPVERVSAVLRSAAVDARLEEFPAGTRTANDAAAAIGCELSQIVKTVVLVSDGAYVLALVPGDRRADEALVADALSAAEVRVARPEEVLRATGFEPGAVAPFPVRAVAHTLMDKDFFRHQLVWIGAGSPAHMAALPPGELQRLTRATVFAVETDG